MSKPLTMTQNAEEGDRTTIRLRIERHADDGIVQAILAQRAWAEVDALRAALAAAEAKLASSDELYRAAMTRWNEAASALADERRHADHQNASLECSLECVCDSMCPTTWPTGEARPHHAMCVAVRATLAAHAARRAAAATLSDAGASSEVANDRP